MSFALKKKICILLIIFLIFLSALPVLLLKKKQPEGEYLKKEEIWSLTDLLETMLEESSSKQADSTENILKQKERMAALKEIVDGWDVREYVTYKQIKQWMENEAVADVYAENEKKHMAQSYRNSFFVTKEDWYLYFEKVCSTLDTEGRITTKELLILGDSFSVADVEGNPIEENYVFTQNGSWEKRISADFIPKQQKASYITYHGALWGVYNVQEEAVLSNVWLVENTKEELMYFYKNYQVTTEKGTLDFDTREQVADLCFRKGELQEAKVKSEKITGKVLKMSAKEAEIEGAGTFPISENIQYYRLYDRLENVGRNEVRLGYDFTDFIVEDGQIQSALLVKDEKMENIRVLIKNSNFEGYFHDRIEGRADVDMELFCGKEKYEIHAGESFCIYPDSEYFVTNRIYLKPKALTGRTQFLNLERNNGGQGYYGSFELEKREEGILLINEVLLEEYLYAVVPSEMPGYYPLEALKAQAICARTYAYDKMLHCGLSSYGANLDDSAAYQVYNNIKENANTTVAVKETRGELLYSGNQLAGTYYYSTSCGFGTDGSIWNADNINTLPYLKAKEMTMQAASYTAEEMKDEKIFAQFITQKNSSHFESEESWYRWTYEHFNMDVTAEKLMKRLENYPAYVSTSRDGVTWEKEPLEAGFTITDIQVKKRGAGGTIEELLVSTDKGSVLVKNEYHVRAVLTDGESAAHLQNSDTYACGNLLPSAFFLVNPVKEDGKVTGIKLMGGGFGHGAGMSQNGAKNLAQQGNRAEDILEFYYENCQVKKQR